MRNKIKSVRISWIDKVRGGATIAMILYHFLWDLNAEIWHQNFPKWVWRMGSFPIAGTFLFLVGFTTALEAKRLDRAESKKKLHAKATRVFLAALLVTAGSFVAFPTRPILFGILHCIAVSYLLLVFFSKQSNKVILAFAAVFFCVGFTLYFWPLNQMLFVWLISSGQFFTSDHFPLLPWFSVVLTGFYFGQRYQKVAVGVQKVSGAKRKAPETFWLEFVGRHTLLIYLLHQPLMVGAIRLYLQFAN